MNLGAPKTIGGLRIAFGLASNVPHAGRLAPMAQE